MTSKEGNAFCLLPGNLPPAPLNRKGSPPGQ
uniref:Uncharacterized protein n=1 Tax=Myoviridae sp. cteBs22 TaxID=2826675 RepID=A0A8S5R121_9CAUD|nr:MAG TPA: hypothetical protein [Myoviridae sp. cteBs22]